MASLIKRPSAGAGAQGNRFQYRPRTAEEIRERQQQRGGSREGIWLPDVQFFKTRQGDNDVRLMPPTWVDARHYGLEVRLHYDVGADESAFLCLKEMFNERCPICEERDRAKASGHQDYADSLKPGKRVAVYLVDRKEESKGPVVWSMPWTVDRDISNLCIDGKTGEIYAIDNPDAGFDVQFKREGERDRTKYTGIQIARRSSPLCDNAQTMDKWLQYIVDHPLTALLNKHEYEYIAEAFNPGGATGSLSDRAAQSPKAAERAAAREAKGKGGDAAPQQPARERASLSRPAASQPAQPAAAPAGDKPTWDDLTKMNEETLAAVGQDFKLVFPDDGFEPKGQDGLDSLREWLADKLSISRPGAQAAAQPASTPGGWRARLAQTVKT